MDWKAVWANAQRRWAYGSFVLALTLLTWLVFRTVPPTAEIHWVGPLWALSQIPIVGALASTIVCALITWPISISLLSGRRTWAPFFCGALIGVLTLLASAAITHFGYMIVESATSSRSDWAFILGPLYFLTYATLTQAWISMLASAVIGGFAFAFSEAVSVALDP